MGKSSLNLHIHSIHLKLKSYVCDQCKKSFTQEGNLKRHVNAIHLKPYECQQCKNSFTDERNMEQHSKKIHLNCTDCDYSSIWEKRMKIHVETVHQKARTHKCDQCKKSFSQKRHLSGSVWLRQPTEDLRFDLGISFYGFTRCSWTMPTLRKSPFVIRALLAPCAAVAVQ